MCHDKRISSDIFMPDNLIPKQCLYQYRAINKHSLINLITSTIFVGNPNNFNDPYDSDYSVLYRKLTEKFSSAVDVFEDKSKKYTTMLNEKVRAITPVNEEILEIASLESELAQTRAETVSALLKIINTYTRSVACFSGVKPTGAKAILMWSHYANRHTGICLEFDTSNYKSGNEKGFYLRPVEYSLKRDDFNEVFDDKDYDIEKVLNNGMFKKALFWKYEKEWRLIINADPQCIPYSPELVLRKIYLGARMSGDDKKMIIKIANDKNIDIEETILADDCYKIKLHGR